MKKIKQKNFFRLKKFFKKLKTEKNFKDFERDFIDDLYEKHKNEEIVLKKLH